MQSRAVIFCFGAAVGLGGAVGLYRVRPHLLDISKEPLNQPQEDNYVFRYGYPEAAHISNHSYTGHSLAYDHVKKVPVWVAESINKDMVTSRIARRERSDFQPDPSLPTEYCSSNQDYRGSGWSRGHMAPAGNYKHCQKSMNDTFYLSNIVPQDFNNNSGYWNSVEDYCRRLAKKYSQVSIISGPLYLPQTDPESKKKFVKYEVIGANNVAVPTHLYKVILVEDGSDSSPMMGVFIIPNEPIQDIGLTQFQSSLEEVESHTGTQFHQKLDRSKVRDLCVADGCKLKSQKEWAVLTYRKRVQTAASAEELEKIWGEVQAKGIHHDKGLIDLHSQRKMDLQKVAR